MIKVIMGGKGSGKTKKLIDMATEALAQERGNILFVDDDKRYMYDLDREIRFVDASEYPAVFKKGANEFLGFLCGMLCSNYDLTLVAVDSFRKLVPTDLSGDEMKVFFGELERLSKVHECDFLLSISAPEEEMPEYIKQFAI